jgi:hypothetical protein
MMLVFLRLSEQLGFEWAPRITSKLVDANLAWVKDNKDSMVTVHELEFLYLGRATDSASNARRHLDERSPLAAPPARRQSEATAHNPHLALSSDSVARLSSDKARRPSEERRGAADVGSRRSSDVEREHLARLFLSDSSPASSGLPGFSERVELQLTQCP